MTVTIRSATIADRPSLEIIRRQAIEAEWSGWYERDRFADLVATDDPELRTWIDRDRYMVLVAETKVTPVSFMVCDSVSAELLAVYTAPDYERRGYATQLLRHVEEALDEAVREELAVWSPEPAVPFFRANGFAPTDEREEDPIPRVRLRKRVGITC